MPTDAQMSGLANLVVARATGSSPETVGHTIGRYALNTAMFPLEVLSGAGRLFSEAGNEVARRLIPFSDEDSQRTVAQSLRQTLRATYLPSEARAPAGMQVSKGLRGTSTEQGVLSNILDIAIGVPLDLFRDPVAYASFGPATGLEKMFTAAGREKALTEYGSTVLKTLRAAEEAKLTEQAGVPLTELGKRAAGLKAGQAVENLAAQGENVFARSGLRIGIPFGQKAVIPGTEGAVEAAGRVAGKIADIVPGVGPLKTVFGKNREQFRVIRQTEKNIQELKRGAQIATLAGADKVVQGMAAAAKDAATKGDDPAAIWRTITDAVEAPAGTPMFEQAMGRVPDYATQYVKDLKAAQPEILAVERSFGIETPGLNESIKRKLIERQFDLGKLERLISGEMGEITTGQKKKALARAATIKEEISALRDSLSPTDYFEHLLTPEYRMHLENKGGEWAGISMAVSTRHSSMLQRQFRMSVSEANRLSAEGQIDPDFIGKIFTEDPRVIQTTRLWKNIKTTETARMAENLAQFGVSPRSFDVLNDRNAYTHLPINHHSIDHLVFPKEVAEGVKKMLDPMTSGVVGKAYDAINSWFRRTTVVTHPGTSVRNLLGNIWINAAEGSTKTGDYLDALRVMSGARGSIASKWGKVGYDIIKKAGMDENLMGGSAARALSYEPVDSALANMMIGNPDRVRFLGQMVRKGSLAGLISRAADRIPLFGEKGIVGEGKLMTWMNAKGDELGRVAHFIARVRNGDTFENAAQSVRKYLGSASELTNVEQRTANRVVFFYRWLRHNIPLQISDAIHSPGRFNEMLRVEREAHKYVVKPEDSGFLPGYSEAALNVPLSYDKSKKSYVMTTLGGLIPLADLGMMRVPFIADAESLLRYALQQMTPALTLAPNVITAGAFSRLGAAKERAGAMQTLRIPYINPQGTLIEDPFWGPRIGTIVNNIRLLNTLDRLNDTFREPSGIYGSKKLTQFLTGLSTTEINIPREQSVARDRREELMNAYKRNIRDGFREKNPAKVNSTIESMIRDSGLPLSYFTRSF